MLVCALVTMLVAAPAFAEIVPHVADSPDTDNCAMCHRDHTSASGAEWQDSSGTRASALLVGTSPQLDGDTALCYSCHGVAGLGSDFQVETAFVSTSHHSLAPSTSAYGPSPKQCSDCHDSHGSMKASDGVTNPRLLRSVSVTNSALVYYSGDRYCTACHMPSANNQWDGYSIWVQTKHAEITPTASGTKIVCTVCHDPHGSPNAPSIATQIASPSVPATVGVPANDRWQCYTCHAGEQATYPGGLAYESSGHGASVATVSIPWEWASRDLTPAARNRKAGECQVCHDPMGRDNGSGAPIPKLAEASQEHLCYTCHSEGSTIASDMASLAFKPEAGIRQTVASYGGAPGAEQFGRVQYYTRDTTSTSVITGPREALDGNVGPAAIGDIDGDGDNELLVARSGASTITVLANSALEGIGPSPGDVGVVAPAEFLRAGDVLDDLAGLPEVVTASGSVVRMYRWSGSGLSLVGSVDVTGTVSGLAVGRVLPGTHSQIVVTTNAPDQLVVIDGNSGLPVASAPYATRPSPRGPSIGDLNGDGVGEIAVANNGDPDHPLSVYSGNGTELFYYDATGAGKPAPQDTAIGDVLWGVTPSGTSGDEIAETFSGAAGGAAEIDVFPLKANAIGVDAPQAAALSSGSNPSEMAIGDTNGDGHRELSIAEAGAVTQAVQPGVEVVTVAAPGTAISTTEFFPASGVESAGNAPGQAWIAEGELGAVGPSRHAVETDGAHISTETAGFPRHVECVDCHNPHEATTTVAAAPLAYGSIAGAWGVSIQNAPVGSITYGEQHGITAEYQLCLKCHGQWSAPGSTRDIASEVDTRNPSTHGIEAAPTNSEASYGSFVAKVPAWTNSSVMYCVDCHGNSSSTQTVGPHTSQEAPLLSQPYYGTPSSDSSNLCYKCHTFALYYSGTGDGVSGTGSNFYDASLPAAQRALHHFHVSDKGEGCGACHVTHGSRVQPHLLRDDIGYTHNAPSPTDDPGGSCQNGCHAGVRQGYKHP